MICLSQYLKPLVMTITCWCFGVLAHRCYTCITAYWGSLTQNKAIFTSNLFCLSFPLLSLELWILLLFCQEDEGLREEGTSVETRDGGAIHGKGCLLWSPRAKGLTHEAWKRELGDPRLTSEMNRTAKGRCSGGQGGTGKNRCPRDRWSRTFGDIPGSCPWIRPFCRLWASGPLVSLGDPVRTPES